MAAAMTTIAASRPTFVVARRTSQPAARRAALRVVRANAEPNKEGEQTPSAPAAAPQVVLPPVAAKPAAPGFGDVMAFSGAPEIVNGRLAMLGFLAALGAELSSGAPVTQQLAGAPTAIAATFALFAAASLIPIFKGSKKDTSVGPFTPAVELLNGRAAMLGFAALLIIEGVKGSALF